MPRICWTLEEDERQIARGRSWTFISAARRRDTGAVKLHAGTLQKRAARLQELEEMAAKLLVTAGKLPPFAVNVSARCPFETSTSRAEGEGEGEVTPVASAHSTWN
jgi:hypothetical protein